MKAFRPFDQREKVLLMDMHYSGLKGIPLFKKFRANPVFQDIVKERGTKAISNGIANIRNGKAQWAQDPVTPAPVAKRIGRPPGSMDSKPRKTKKPRRTILRAKKGFRMPSGDDIGYTNDAPVRHAYQFNNCPACGCPLHGAQEGLRTEQELRGAK